MTTQTIDPRDHSLQLRDAIRDLRRIETLIWSGIGALEQLVELPGAQANKTPVSPPSASSQDEHPGEADEEAAKLRELHARPPEAKFTTEEAALYLNCTTALLRTWRWQERGPPHEGAGRMVRYVKGKLDEFMAA